MPSNQIPLCAGDYASLSEQLADPRSTGNEGDALRSLCLYIPLSTYAGGDRYVRRDMYDIISLSHKDGYPNIYLAVTCNPQWLEIKNALLPGQSVIDRPDITARDRVFKLLSMKAFVIYRKATRRSGGSRQSYWVSELKTRSCTLHFLHDSGIKSQST